MKREDAQKSVIFLRTALWFLPLLLPFACALLFFSVGVRQNIVVIGAFVQQSGAQELPLILNSSFSAVLQETLHETGLAALQSAGYETTYLRLFLRSYLWVFAFLVCCVAAAFFYVVQSRRSESKRRLTALRQFCAFATGEAKPPANPQYQDAVATVLLLKQDIARREALHKDDTTRMMRYMEDISHQLKTPLAVIQAACERTMMQHTQTTGAMETCLSQINKAAGSIGELLQLGRFDCGKQVMQFKMISAKNLVEPIVNDLDEIAQQKGLTIITQISDALFVFCDAYWLQEALGNLLKNCIEHSANGTITLCCEADEQFSCIRIQDCGTGLSADAKAHIFERYSFGDRVGKEHAGLGMAIAMQAIRLHFGTITAHNRPAGGVEFEVVFPRLEAESVYQKHASCHVPIKQMGDCVVR